MEPWQEVKQQLERFFVSAVWEWQDFPTTYTWKCRSGENKFDYMYHSFTGWTLAEITEWVDAKLIGCHCKPKKWVDKANQWLMDDGMSLPDCPIHGPILTEMPPTYRLNEARHAWLMGLEVGQMVRATNNKGKVAHYEATGIEKHRMMFKMYEMGAVSCSRSLANEVRWITVVAWNEEIVYGSYNRLV